MNLFIFGLGFTGRWFAGRARDRFMTVRATVTEAASANRIAAETGFTMRAFGPEADDPRIADHLADTDVLLVSAPPGSDGDPVLARYAEAIRASRIAWIGYLSTIGVYGDHDGAWVDEATQPRPGSERSRQRVAAEQGWLDLGRASGKAVQLFRLSGIYGPGRSPLRKVLDGTARRLVKPRQVFNRIHVDDIATVLAASMSRPRAGAIYNVTDDEPAPPQDVVAFAAELAGIESPAEEPFAAAALKPMARSFYGENKRVRNGLLGEELAVKLAFPTYREGLRALAASELPDAGLLRAREQAG
jgi:nucleoside-diphosphate-sugar epimerase